MYNMNKTESDNLVILFDINSIENNIFKAIPHEMYCFFVNYAYSEFKSGSPFQTSLDRGNKRLGKSWPLIK